MIRPRNWPSRRDSSLLTVVISTVNEPAVTVAPLDGDRTGDITGPADSLGALPKSTSLTR